MKKTLKTVFRKGMLFALITAVLLGLMPEMPIRVNASVQLNPHVLSTGTESDLKKTSHYTFDSDGTRLFPLTITSDGCMVVDMIVRSAGYINVELHTRADGSDIPETMACQCTADRGNYGSFTRYLKKGTYYLRFPANSYTLDMVLYSSSSKTIQNNSTVAAYCDYNITDTFTYKSSANGYINLTQKRLINTGASYSVSLCNSKGKKLSDVVCDHNIDNDVIFPVKKGTTYKIKIKTLNVDGQQFYQLKLAFTSRNKKCGTSKSKSAKVAIKSSNDGVIYAEDATSKADWYKFSNSKAQKLTLSYSGYASSGSISFSVYNSSGKLLGTYQLMPGMTTNIDCRIYNRDGKKTVPKGTYYIRVKKSRKQAAGIYSFRVLNR